MQAICLRNNSMQSDDRTCIDWYASAVSKKIKRFTLDYYWACLEHVGHLRRKVHGKLSFWVKVESLRSLSILDKIISMSFKEIFTVQRDDYLIYTFIWCYWLYFRQIKLISYTITTSHTYFFHSNILVMKEIYDILRCWQNARK